MNTEQLKAQADRLRLIAVQMVAQGGDGHPGPALSIADLVTVLYFDTMRINPEKPDWEDRDRFILSKGHACPVLYAALSERGYFGSKVENFHLREMGSTFQGHPVMKKTPGIDMTSGSLGNGIAIGAGMALAARLSGRDYRVYVIIGDGEMQEGVIWEGLNLAAAHKLDNLIVLVDKNGWQSGGQVSEIIGSNNIRNRLDSFGWYSQEIDGHNYTAIQEALNRAKEHRGSPNAIVCNCIKGKGLPFMENNNDWHKKTPTSEEYAQAVAILGGIK